MALQLHSSVARLYHTYRRVSGGGADGRIKGVNGSINPLAVFCMLMAMKVGGRTVFDFGFPPRAILHADPGVPSTHLPTKRRRKALAVDQTLPLTESPSHGNQLTELVIAG